MAPTLTNPPTRRRLITLAAAAEHLGTCRRTIRRRIAAGDLIGYRLGPRMIRVDLAEVDALLAPIPSARIGSP